MARRVTVAERGADDWNLRSWGLLYLVMTAVFLTVGCQRTESLPALEKLGHSTADFDIYWPPADPVEAVPRAVKPLLHGVLTLDATDQAGGETELRLAMTLTRPSAEADRQSWNSALAFADIAWMNQVRVWDQDRKWLWPNLPFLLRLPGQERVKRYGGLDPGKHVDNDFAAVLIRKFAADGVSESAETKDTPFVSAEWHPVGAEAIDKYSIVHAARSDEFVVHLGRQQGPTRGQLKVWLIYADFLGANPPRTWPQDREWAGGILAFFEIDWAASPGHGCRAVARQKRPQESTRFDWAKWVVRTLDSDESEAKARLSDLPD